MSSEFNPGDVVCNRDMLDGWLIAQADAIAAVEIEIERY